MVSAESADVPTEGDVQVDHQTALSQGATRDSLIQRIPKTSIVPLGGIDRSKGGVKEHDVGEYELKGVQHY